MGQRLGPQRGGGAPATEPATAAGWLRAGCRYAPAAAAGAFVLAQLLLVIPGTGLGWDEIVYVSQVEPGTPTAYFSAPRARGVSWLAAPAAALAGSAAHPAVLRTYLALLSGLGLLIALRAWRRLLPPAVLGCAGLLFASLWITLYYGPRAMPNLWCALGALAATGWFLRAVAPPCRGTPAGHRALLLAGAAVAFVTAMRPGDGAWLTLPLTAAALLIRPWRRAPTVLVPPAAFAVGAAPWLIEAYTSYDGPLARVERAGEIQGGMGLRLAVDDQVRSLAGRTLCRPCDVPWSHPWTAAWWLVLPVLTALGVWCARRAGRGPAALLAVAVAGCLAVTYLFTIDYAAPRFLLSAYALLALPVAEGVVTAARAVTASRPAGPARSGQQWWRAAAGAALTAALLAHLAVQYAVLAQASERSRRQHRDLTAAATELRRHAVRPPCVITGGDYVPIAHYTGCSSRQPAGHDDSITSGRLLALGRTMPLVVLTAPGRPRPSLARDLTPVTLPGGRVAWLPPPEREPATRPARPPARVGRTGTSTPTDAPSSRPTPRTTTPGP
ncbi:MULTISPECIES: hypothetical protein [unclassified Streptomyces]|uniref:hypothetical protein n=1 Tax=unclassified Streptomyces TaxID=2593676 RepID=UPI00324B0BFD